MDDIAFFDSSSYTHRGGIWPDAGRREKPNVSDVSNLPSVVDDDVSTVSAPPDVDSSSLTSGDLDPSYHHHSAALPPSRGPSPTPDPSHHDLLHPREHDLPVEDPNLQTEAAVLEVQQPNLRHKGSSSSEKSKKRFLGIRRASNSPSPGPGSRPSSREQSPAPSLENLRTASPELLNSAGTHSDARPTKSPTPSGQSSLLSTLKSRAGDRQALSNTARETMRKWTVNWGGLKKDRDLGVASSEDAEDGRDPKPRSVSQKVKSSYADIRAAVDERRERERRSSDVSSAPVPNRGHEERADSASSTREPRRSSVSSIQTESSAVPSSADQPTGTPPDVSTTTLPTIDIEGTQPDSQEVNGIEPASIATRSPPALPQRPIQSQPSHGKTMTIPGIHARNRGEVMSMGFIPPSPPAPEAKSPVSSVYRLWKHSPATQFEHADDGIERTITDPSPVLSADSAEPSPEPSSPTNTVRPQAPQLPPRTLHTVPSDSSSVSPASVALKSIASHDEGCRANDGEGIEASNASNPPAPVSPKPPLPPRKIQASA
jgi:hypothetical protein